MVEEKAAAQKNEKSKAKFAKDFGVTSMRDFI
jgi:hypothetical protein